MTLGSNRPAAELTFSTALPELPAFITLEDEKQYDITGDVWRFPEGGGIKSHVKFNWLLLANIIVEGIATPVMSERAVTLVKLYVLERLNAGGDSIKPQSAHTYLRATLAFARHLAAHTTWMPVGRSFDWSDMSAEMFDAWLTLEYRKKRKGNFAGLVRRFYLWGADPKRRLPDFSPDLASRLTSIKIKGNAEGELVESRDAKRGPFTREELEMIYDACEAGAGED